MTSNSAYFRHLGVIRAYNFADLLDIYFAPPTGRVMQGTLVAIMTSIGGAGTLIADNLSVKGVQTSLPGGERAARLRALDVGDRAVIDRNPIDLALAVLQPEIWRGAFSIPLESPDYDAVISVVGSSELGPTAPDDRCHP